MGQGDHAVVYLWTRKFIEQFRRQKCPMDLSVDEVGQPTSLFNCPINRPLNMFTTRIQIRYFHFMPWLSATSFCFYFISISSPTYLPKPLFLPSCSSNLNSLREITAGEMGTNKKNGKVRHWGEHSKGDHTVEIFLGEFRSLHLYAYKGLQLNLHSILFSY